MNSENLNVASIILEQLGGNKFLAMTGAKDLTAVEKGLVFRLPASFAKDGINRVEITLDPTDTYTLGFHKFGPKPSLKALLAGKTQQDTMIREYVLITADNLQRTFTLATGLNTSL